MKTERWRRIGAIVHSSGGHVFTWGETMMPVKALARGRDSGRLDDIIDRTGNKHFAEASRLIGRVSFHEADASGPFELLRNFDGVLGWLVRHFGVEAVAGRLKVNGSQEATFQAMWDYLDDQYVTGGPNNAATNESFVRLGVKYVHYLKKGGEPLTDVTAKFTADNDGDGIPQREQSMHDNLLGNLTDAAINSRFTGALRTKLLALVPDEYGARPYYDGNESNVGGAAHDAVRAFDYDRGWARPDYLDRNLDGLIHPLARDGGQMYYGTGNTIHDWNIVRHEGAQVELGLKIKHRQGTEYDEAFVDADGIAHYEVNGGTQIGNPARAEWSFDFAATDYSPDENFTYRMEIDLDPGEEVDWLTVYSSASPFDTDVGTGATFQNSSNYAFYRNLIDIDPAASGIQPYAYGEGEFNVRLTVFGDDSAMPIAMHEVVVHVEAPII